MTTGGAGCCLALHPFTVKNTNTLKLVMYFYSLYKELSYRLKEIKESCCKYKAGH